MASGKQGGVEAAGVRPVVLSGGSGTRLWPVSRLAHPKQLLPITDNHSMLEATALRCRDSLFLPMVVVTAEDHRFRVAEQLQSSNARVDAIILEPAARNTAPAIALAAHWCLARGDDQPMLVMPSDHVIRDVEAFAESVRAALPAALNGSLVTFGVRPNGPNTGYGYIEAGDRRSAGSEVRRVERFIEKPDAESAARYAAADNFFWNAGIFLFLPSAFLAELERHDPALAAAVARSMERGTSDGSFVRPEAASFTNAQNISIDYAVMEKTDRAMVVPVDIGWSDVGAWDSVWQAMPKNEDGNVIRGDVVAIDATDCLIRCDADMTVAVVGLDKMIVVVTGDAVFIAPVDQAQEARRVVDQLRSQGHTRADTPAQVFRPWGSYQTTDRGEGFQTKRIIVNPGAELSLQKHFHRSEHWIVVSGTAQVTVGEEVSTLRENQSTYIPCGEIHRLANPGRVPLHLVEVQCGSYLGEDDIVRLEDVYGRS